MVKAILIIIFQAVIFQSIGQCTIERTTIDQNKSHSFVPVFYRLTDTISFADDPCPALGQKLKGLLSSNSTLNNDWYFTRLEFKQPGDEILVELDNSQTDHIDIFLLEQGDINLALKAGDKIAFKDRLSSHRNILFQLPDFQSSTALLINIRNRASYSIRVNVYDQDYFIEMDSKRTLILGMYLGLVLIFIIFVSTGWVLAKYNHTYLYYLIYLIFAGLYFFSELGFADIYLWPDSPSLEEPFLFIFVLGSTIPFLLLVKDLFQIDKNSKAHAYFFRIILVCSAICLLSIIFNLIRNDTVFVLIYNLVLLIVGATFLYALFVGLKAISRKIPYAKYFLIAFSAMIIGIVLKPASLFGIIPYTSAVHYAGIIGQGFEIICLSTLLLLEFFNRTRYASRLETEMVRLEKSALQAQMNPHFIFNSLNSIQNFISKNEKVMAMDYLSKFARLIRNTLNVSSSKKISLTDEIEMLKNYMDLEKMRFKDKFDYVIKADEEIEPDDMMIPPLMIQPFVENAIIHGFKGIEKEGLITIEFQLKNNRLEVIVEDNGSGIQQSVSNKTHKSMAISVTQQRLTHLNRLDSGSDLVIGAPSNGKGTKVIMHLDIDETDE